MKKHFESSKHFSLCAITMSLLSLCGCFIFTSCEKKDADLKSGDLYGIRWSITDETDLGERCFSSVGLQATIGVGSQYGRSDFDNIFPWSDIKRCNIKQAGDKEYSLVFEGEPGFSLDGSNGDVFVRIPKFNISRFVLDGYEYRVIGDKDSSVHEAFIENGEVLDEIYISAFEGFLENGELFSKANLIPSSNYEAHDFLDGAKQKGNGYSLYDNRCVDMIWSLMAIEYGKRNTNRIIGYGLADLLQPTSNNLVENNETTNVARVKMSLYEMQQMPVGSTITICDKEQTNVIAQRTILNVQKDGDCFLITFDGSPISLSSTCFVGSGACKTNFCETVPGEALKWHTGRARWNDSESTRNPVRYRWIENPVGNLWHLLPDVTFYNGCMYYCKDMANYSFGKYDGINYIKTDSVYTENNDNGTKSDVRNANYWITGLTNDPKAAAVPFGKSFSKKLRSSEGFGGYYYLNASGVVFIANGGGFDHLWRCNMLTNRAWIRETSRWYLYGARLMFKHVDTTTRL